jgi:hypothetical protein
MEKFRSSPSLEQAAELLEEYLTREFTVQVNGLCSVNYRGRASSKLDRGERLFVKKQDSALLVHGPENYQPKNWQPEVDSWTVEMEEDALLVEARRHSPEELVEIRFESVDLVSVHRLVDRSELRVRGHEVDIHEAVEESPEIVEDEFSVVERERETPAGFIDVLGRDSENRHVVVEVKRNPDYNTVLQLQRYVEEIEKEFAGSVRGVLLAPKMTDKVLDYLEERGLEFVEVEMEDVIASYESLDRSQKGLSDFSPDYST